MNYFLSALALAREVLRGPAPSHSSLPHPHPSCHLSPGLSSLALPHPSFPSGLTVLSPEHLSAALSALVPPILSYAGGLLCMRPAGQALHAPPAPCPDPPLSLCAFLLHVPEASPSPTRALLAGLYFSGAVCDCVVSHWHFPTSHADAPNPSPDPGPSFICEVCCKALRSSCGDLACVSATPRASLAASLR